ncbi:MAG: TIGR00730 family Rossman fold protein [Rhizobiaceae bacterium]
MTPIRSICVYCGSSPGNDPRYIEAARMLGHAIAMSGLRLVYGGGTRGIMGAVSEAALNAGGKVTGIIPQFLMTREAAESELDRLTDLIVTDDMHQRKHALFEHSDAFVAMPGGIGTLEEIIEIMTWAQLGHHTKPIVLANINHFWDPLNGLLNHMREAGFIHTANLVKPLVVNSAEAIVPAILAASVKAPGAGGDTEIIDKL